MATKCLKFSPRFYVQSLYKEKRFDQSNIKVRFTLFFFDSYTFMYANHLLNTKLG